MKLGEAHEAYGSLCCGWKGVFGEIATTDIVFDSLLGVVTHSKTIAGAAGVDIGNFGREGRWTLVVNIKETIPATGATEDPKGGTGRSGRTMCEVFHWNVVWNGRGGSKNTPFRYWHKREVGRGNATKVGRRGHDGRVSLRVADAYKGQEQGGYFLVAWTNVPLH